MALEESAQQEVVLQRVGVFMQGSGARRRLLVERGIVDQLSYRSLSAIDLGRDLVDVTERLFARYPASDRPCWKRSEISKGGSLSIVSPPLSLGASSEPKEISTYLSPSSPSD